MIVTILELTICDWVQIIMLFLAVGKIWADAKQKRIDILNRLRSFRLKLELEYATKEDSIANVKTMQIEVLDILCEAKATVFFGSFFHPFKYREEIFLVACRNFFTHREGVTYTDVIASAIGLVDDLILFLTGRE